MDEGLRGAKIKPISSEAGAFSVAASRCYLIFNPRSASTKATDSSPRALSIRSAVYPKSIFAELKKRGVSTQQLPPAARIEFTVDSTGVVTKAVALELSDESLASAAAEAAKAWRFAPARKGGSPIEATVQALVLFNWPARFEVSELTKPPKVIKQVKPEYPMSERRGGFNGEVVVEFVVTPTGDVRDVTVFRSTNPACNESALNAVRQWKFEPGLVNKRPVNARMRVPMVFELEGLVSGDRYEVSQKGKGSHLPPELQNDFPPKPQNVALGVYPFDQLWKNEHQTVTLQFAVRPDGVVIFADKKDQTLSEFDYAARAMVEEFVFIPASKNGKPNWGLLKMEVEFDSNSQQVMISDSARRILRELRKKEPAILQANQVDQKPEVTASRKPVYPSNLLEANIEGQTLIEVYIDEEGHVQLPKIISASHPSFGYAAAQAISQWRFKPLTRAGKPAIVKVRVPLVFSRHASPKSEPGSETDT